MGVTRFPNGIGDREGEHIFKDLPTLDPCKTHQFFDDFNYFDASHWNSIASGGGIQELSVRHGGIILNLTGASTTDRIELQGLDNQLTLGSQLWFSTRIAPWAGRIFTDMDVYFGCAPTGEMLFSGTFRGTLFQVTNDALRIVQFDDAGNLLFSEDIDFDITTLALEEFITLDYVWDPANNELIYGINGRSLGRLPSGPAARIEAVTMLCGAAKVGNDLDFQIAVDFLSAIHLRDGAFFPIS